MKKCLIVLLGAAFAVSLAAVVLLVGSCLSPRQALYTVTDAMMNSAYRFRRGWQARTFVP